MLQFVSNSFKKCKNNNENKNKEIKKIKKRDIWYNRYMLEVQDGYKNKIRR